MLPHAAHARQVVLELRELDLQLPLGARRVLREDVEDQLRAVDDARVERVLEVALLRGIELVVDDHALGARLREALLQLLELALADVRALRRTRAVLHDARRPARRRRCAPARSPRRAPRRDPRPEPAPRGRTRARAPEYVESSTSIMALAQRTLGSRLVISPRSRGARRQLHRLRAGRSCPSSTAFSDGESLLYAKRTGKPLVLLAGPHRHGPGPGQPARPDRGRRRRRPRGERHEGRRSR